MALKEIKSPNDLKELEKTYPLIIIHFMADWAPQCNDMNNVLIELSKEVKDACFAKIYAEDVSEVSLKFNISAVPTFIILQNGAVADRIDGANAAELMAKVKRQSSKSLDSFKPPTEEDLNSRLVKLINSSKVMLFMKGSPSNPRCGFSRQTIELLNSHNAEYGYFDILTDEGVRQGLKKHSEWPTYPQLYIDGTLIGGLDILKEMNESDELGPMLPKKVSLEDRLKSLISKAPLTVFMKGNPSTPRCGFSRQIIEILNDTKLPYDTFDILLDEEVRQGLKTFSNWPTYPQVYINGELIGGLDIIKEMKAEGSLIDTLRGN